ncbi:hypothetical protein CMT41_18205 [Colwellia sp. MT41]|uniref:GNAT family N-acetyltransferase n=1 Tax=Colwellia sp. MT41 TaxID=58049 RepID=UPI000717B2CA|nr:GNAT family N-acetyltransferase [Colwellia sp. MT41]ALO36458.1 hypothetical protein CMT41_18205 [Colwellia sp. MT41]
MHEIIFARKKLNEMTFLEIHEWSELTSSSTHFSSPFYQYDFAKVANDTGNLVEVILGYVNKSVVFILPFQYDSIIAKILGLARRVGGQLSDYSGAIISSNIAFNIDVASLPLSYLFLDHVPKQCQRLNVEEGYFYQEDSSQIILSGDSDTYFDEFKKRNKKYYNDVKRLERMAERDFGPINFTYKSIDQREFEHLINKKIAQYKQMGVKNPLEKDWTKEMLRTLFKGGLANITPVLSVLNAGDKWLASHFGVEANGIFHYWFPVHNNEVNKYSPGKQLLFKIIEKSYSENIHCIDLGLGETAFKDKFCNNSIPLYKTQMVSNSIYGKFTKAYQAALWKFKAV